MTINAQYPARLATLQAKKGAESTNPKQIPSINLALRSFLPARQLSGIAPAGHAPARTEADYELTFNLDHSVGADQGALNRDLILYCHEVSKSRILLIPIAISKTRCCVAAKLPAP